MEAMPHACDSHPPLSARSYGQALPGPVPIAPGFNHKKHFTSLDGKVRWTMGRGSREGALDDGEEGERWQQCRTSPLPSPVHQVQNALRVADSRPEVTDLYMAQSGAVAGPYAVPVGGAGGVVRGRPTYAQQQQQQHGDGGDGGDGGEGSDPHQQSGPPGLGGNVPGAGSAAARAFAAADEDTRRLLSVIWNLLIPRGGM